MEILIKSMELIQKSVKVTDVFSDEVLDEVGLTIASDLVEELDRDRMFEDSALRSIKIEIQGMKYAEYALELSLYDFLQEFDAYVEEYWYEYEEFVDRVKKGYVNIKVDID